MDDKLNQAIQANRTDELTLDFLTKEEAGRDEPTLVATGNATIEPPEQKIKDYVIDLVIFDIEKSEIQAEGWDYDEAQKQATKVVKFSAKRLPAIKRAKLIGLLAPVLLSMGIVTTDGEVYAKPQVDMRDILTWLRFLPQIVEIANLMFNIPEENADFLENADPGSLAKFFMDLLVNEQQLIEETARFLYTPKSPVSK